MKKFFTIILVVGLTAAVNNAQEGNVWNGHSCAVVLTYDDGLNIHLDKVIPSLDSLGFRGTFYIPGNAATIKNRAADWKIAASEGHELGNHTLFHPCAGEGRPWVTKDYDLDNYSVNRYMDEIRVSNTILFMIDGLKNRTLAYTCGNTLAGTESFVEQIKGEFPAARGVSSGYETLNGIDLYNTKAFMMSGQTGDELIGMVKEAMETKTLLIFLFHGVGGEHNINISLKAHNELLGFLDDNKEDIWVAPMLEVAELIKNYKAAK
jgi:sialate O-acetylesterase